jgi:hypothetical protein
MSVYFVKVGNRVKIGFTNGPVRKRLGNLQTGWPEKFELIDTIPGADRNDELELHQEYAEYREHGEWFRCEGRLEDLIEHMKRKPCDNRG